MKSVCMVERLGEIGYICNRSPEAATRRQAMAKRFWRKRSDQTVSHFGTVAQPAHSELIQRVRRFEFSGVVTPSIDADWLSHLMSRLVAHMCRNVPSECSSASWRWGMQSCKNVLSQHELSQHDLSQHDLSQHDLSPLQPWLAILGLGQEVS